MKPRKKGQQYEISYRYPGYSKPFYERFSSYEEANLRIAQIEYEKSLGVFQPPKPVPIPIRSTRQKYITVGELMDEYVQVYGLNHWGDSFLSCSKHRIGHYIKPYLGNVAVKDLTTHDLDLFYDSLQDKRAVRVTLPKYRSAERDVWSASEAQYALDCCSDPVLHTAMLLALGCSMRIGEILGLT